MLFYNKVDGQIIFTKIIHWNSRVILASLAEPNLNMSSRNPSFFNNSRFRVRFDPTELETSKYWKISVDRTNLVRYYRVWMKWNSRIFLVYRTVFRCFNIEKKLGFHELMFFFNSVRQAKKILEFHYSYDQPNHMNLNQLIKIQSVIEDY